MSERSEIEALWQAYVASQPEGTRTTAAYGTWSFGHTPELADRLGRLAFDGIKTAMAHVRHLSVGIGHRPARQPGHHVIKDPDIPHTPPLLDSRQPSR